MFTFNGKYEIDKRYIDTWIWVVSNHPNHFGHIDTTLKKWIKDRKGNFAPAIPKEGEAEAEATVITPDYHCGYTVNMRKPKEK